MFRNPSRLAEVFGFTETARFTSSDERLSHGEMSVGDGLIMLACPSPDYEGPRRHRNNCEIAASWSALPWLIDNGRRVMLLANAQHDEGLWLINDRDLPNRAISTPMRSPVPTADGKSVVFGSPDIGLVRSDLTGENRIVIKASSALEFPTDISGDVLLFNVYSSEMKNDIWSLKVLPDGRPVPGAEPVAYLQTPAFEVPGGFAPGQNQKWLAYTSNKTERHEVYMQSYPTKGEDIPISDAGGSHPVWGPDGRELFYLGLDNKLMVVQVKYGANSVFPSKPQPLFPLTVDSVVVRPPYDTVDGKQFLVLVPVAPANRPLQAIDNWPLLLEKR